MGNHEVRSIDSDDNNLKTFIKALLKDIQALGTMLDDGWFEIDKMRIGAEQELCLVDQSAKPLTNAMSILEELNQEALTTELARFNLEVNLSPREFCGDALSQMESELHQYIEMICESVRRDGGDIVLAGILPTIRKHDLDFEKITPQERYYAICNAISKLRGRDYELRLEGIDELMMKFDSPLIEACTTGFQVHMQVKPQNFVQRYNVSQAIAAPVLAAAVNSPILFGKRLWHETRVGLFQQTIDTRKAEGHLRDVSPRVTFGNHWLKDSILEVYKEDIARYRVLLSSESTEDVIALMKEGKTPKLKALQVHNSTVYRWNRPCYGISEGKAHLRIENRILPAGPTVIDEMSNAALWLGLLNGFEDEIADVSKVMHFEDARTNFLVASKFGLETKFSWLNSKKVTASDLLLETLIPIAKHGLQKANVNSSDIDKYLGVIEERVKSGQTGSQWALSSYNNLRREASKEQTIAALTMSMITHQDTSKPVHTWELATMDQLKKWKPEQLLVEEFMTTNLVTVHADDLLTFLSHLMEWEGVRYICVETENKELVGLVSSKTVMRYFTGTNKDDENAEVADMLVKDVMNTDVVTIHPEATILEAIKKMEKNKIGSLPVIKDSQLVGIITEKNFLNITARLLKIAESDTK